MQTESKNTEKEGNELIAAFMECTQSFDTYYNKIGKYHFDINDAEYHSSWDWIMPVIEKIEALNDDTVDKVWVSINGRECGMWTYFDASDVLRAGSGNNPFKIKRTASTKIESVWLAVVDFITWYNTNKK